MMMHIHAVNLVILLFVDSLHVLVPDVASY